MASPSIEPRIEVARSNVQAAPFRRHQDPHQESHSDHGEVLRDIIIGFADGLTVPFALTAGLSSYAIMITLVSS